MERELDLVELYHLLTFRPASETPRLLPGSLDHAGDFAVHLNYTRELMLINLSSKDILLQNAASSVAELVHWLEAHVRGNLQQAQDAWASRLYLSLSDAVAGGLDARGAFEQLHTQKVIDAYLGKDDLM